MVQRVLVTGATGMLGSTIVSLLSKNYDVYATGNSLLEVNDFDNYMPFDLGSEFYESLISWANPDVIIHCAAITNGNECVKEPLKAYNINGLSVKKLLNSTADNVKIIYISTDAVFPGYLHLAKETDLVSPESIYGKSKELGEFFLLQSKRNYSIIRTTIVGLNTIKNGNSFAEWIIYSIKNNIEISLFDDVLFTPISIWDLAIQISEVVIPNDLKGVYHITGSEVCSKYKFGFSLMEALGLKSESLLKRGSIYNFSERANRAGDQTLSIELYTSMFGNLPDLESTVNKIKCYYETIKARSQDC